MKLVTRYVNKETRDELSERSNNMCECCGVDFKGDKHHIKEFSDGGETTFENLIILCQTCHKQLPEYLKESQQIELQKWHKNKIKPNTNANHHFSSPINQFSIGSNTYEGCRCILSVNGQNVISPAEINGRFYVNIVMLDTKFPNRMLVLNNRVIVNDDCKISTSSEELAVVVEDKEILRIYRGGTTVKINMDVIYNGNTIKFTEEESIFPGLTVRNCHFKGGMAFNISNS